MIAIYMYFKIYRGNLGNLLNSSVECEKPIILLENKSELSMLSLVYVFPLFASPFFVSPNYSFSSSSCVISVQIMSILVIITRVRIVNLRGLGTWSFEE